MTQDPVEKEIVVGAVSGVKQNKKGGSFISVKDQAGNWWYVGDVKLFPLFKKGETINCLIDASNDFKKILDVIQDGALVKSGSKGAAPAMPKFNPQLDRIESRVEDIAQMLEDYINSKPPLE